MIKYLCVPMSVNDDDQSKFTAKIHLPPISNTPCSTKRSITKLRGGSSGSGVSSPHLIQKGGISPIILGRIIQ